ncbi:MAG: gamma carbonic anhydrase family protein [Zetaproteobacteria bacterium CG06_land_8_20_14_3_00_59_53]|nr:MAG: gamma carbonic anhydrase family protein [Zetaproteobacteria bacterium CG2_30_59_37]PIO90729.1 MAG: gamma carbonic anhydrase family protein [Zetaproteobacteria bacterium CG23_combo_of_CG06-09_8_20_14_all_59_86]PIQ65301.1 MAG: gamma carbonic anhydrase family protein [Zetaproteobacteria bacterium CG11_big_fil_rev_8_21_14_0_20_59_439]PIU69843.1 MAG: gamma carbonic anhydrase family protein [Zetaproteobacteria bacterium CG06_land_8_20_14_3_00_59_53]PIU97369.1 MAG: gamma carbonic anhydrase fam
MITSYLDWTPEIDTSAFVADSAEIMGRVTIGPDSNIWYQCVLRGDVHDIRIGARSNIQDHSTLHTSRNVAPCIVGDDVTVGHRVLLHGCEIGDGCLVGMGSILMDRSRMEPGCLLAAGSLVTEGKVLRGGYLYAGSPARELRELKDEEKAFLKASATHYVALSKSHIRKP